MYGQLLKLWVILAAVASSISADKHNPSSFDSENCTCHINDIVRRYCNGVVLMDLHCSVNGNNDDVFEYYANISNDMTVFAIRNDRFIVNGETKCENLYLVEEHSFFEVRS